MKPLGYGLFLRASLPALWIASALCSCVNLAPAGEVRRLDSLNHLSYTWRYKDLDQAVRTARQAYHAVTLYTQGKAEAANALAFCAFMKMDFEGARAYYKEVYSLTQNELELLIADVGMMKVCQRMALNKSFYDYRNSAIRRMKRIDEDQNLFLERHERRRLIYARSEFQIVSAVYYYYLQQRPQAVEAINRVEVDQLLPDTNQLLYYHYIRAASQLCDGATAEERRVAEFDELFTTYRTASHGDYLYFEGNAAQGLANLLLSPATFAYLQHRRSHALNQLAPVDSLLPFRLGQQALASFQRYGDRYQIAGAYVTIGRYLNRHGSYRAALDTLSRALACVNDSVNTVPECVSRIREQLSVTYAGLGDKTNSDYNRNIYLDILEETRQDRELESRYQALQDEISRLNMITWGVIGGFFLVGLLFWYINKRGKKREGAYLEELRGLIHHAFSDWEQANERTALTLTEQRKQLEKQRYIYQQHITEGKRQNILKKVCLSIVQGMTPYIDRIVREVHKLALTPDVPQRAERYQYIDELTTTINEYNDVLSQWIQLKQGTVRLHIEHVALSELFDLIEKGARAFELKRLTLEVRPTTAVVKADRALTLFMINTLVENARKFTPPGGRVSVSARVQDEGELIEIAVEDTGIGLTPAEVAHITTDKVYDPHQIGLAQTGNAELLKNKGSGYGLMNCRGIMEKYRKSSPLFRSCTFGVESRVGQGSRFYFRLPSGVRKTVMMLLCACTAGFTFAQTVPADEEGAYEVLLNRASDYADEAYFSNVDGRFEQALCDVDSAIACLNAHYRRYVSTPTDFMTLTGEEEQAQPAELVWWHSTFDSDFHVILDIRNEAAVAFLALKQWDAYYYNNTIYTTLYKLLGEDRSLEAYCRTLERSAGNRQVGILLFIGLVCALLAGYYILYIRKRLANRWNLEQVFEINKQLFAAAVVEEPSEEEVRDIPERMARKAFDAVNELIPINRMLIRVQSDETTPSDGQTDGMLAFPLRVESDADSAYVGTLYLELREVRLSEDMRLLLQLVARYMAIVINNAVVQLSSRYHDIETALDQAARANREDEQLHVQNMVLDNSLSTIKHETSYYPTKIKLLITKLRTGGLSAEAQEETIRSIDELVTYYKGIFTILSRCASRPLEEITFRRTTLEVQQLLSYARQYFQKAIAKTSARITLVVEESGDGCVVGDPTELRYLLECLLDEALTSPLEGTLLLSAADNGDYIRFSFTDRRRNKSTEELNTLFYPHLGQHAVYLVGKQIIREHDEYAGRRGCRINAEQTPGGGFTLYFTIPKKQ